MSTRQKGKTRRVVAPGKRSLEVLICACDKCNSPDHLIIGLETTDYQTVWVLCEACKYVTARWKLTEPIKEAMQADKAMSSVQ
jgi:hypothetical protein